MCPKGKAAQHEADHSSPFNVKVKNGGTILPVPVYLLVFLIN
jgi:hypothetical protein